MPIKKITIEELSPLALQNPVFDVRSPGEYNHAHLPGAFNLPLFSDEERKDIGTAYKQQSREKAIKLGLDFFGVKMRKMVEEVEEIVHSSKVKVSCLINEQHSKHETTQNPEPGTMNSVIIHCWRGGMRSSAVAWLLNFYGFEVYLLEGGYKVYRNWVLQQFEKEYDFNVVGGFTGSGKTELIKALGESEHAIIDLEGLANHKGSAFGAIGQPPQPTQEMFENLLASALHQNSNKNFWLEDESRRIGTLNIPLSFWNRMRNKPVYFVEIPFEERLEHIMSGYGVIEKELLINSILRIKKRLGPMETKTAIGFLLEDDTRESFRILLSYYDKTYLKSLNNRENLSGLLNKIDCPAVDPISNIQKLLTCVPVNV